VTISPLDKWYGFIKSHDPAALWDLLHPNAVFESRITHFKVMVRPLKAMNLLHRLMGEQLAKP
jgi:hypothetical protein